jgi:hypothetical protein
LSDSLISGSILLPSSILVNINNKINATFII